MARKKLTSEVLQLVLHEAGFHCANPACRTILTLDIHHIEHVSKSGSNGPDNLLPLCPNCHRLHHTGVIPLPSIRCWKMLLLSLNEAFDKRQLELLLMLSKVKALFISSYTVVRFAGLLASGMVCLYETNRYVPIMHYHVALTPKGLALVNAWMAGDQETAISSNESDTSRAVFPGEALPPDLLKWGDRSPHAERKTDLQGHSKSDD